MPKPIPLFLCRNWCEPLNEVKIDVKTNDILSYIIEPIYTVQYY